MAEGNEKLNIMNILSEYPDLFNDETLIMRSLTLGVMVLADKEKSIDSIAFASFHPIEYNQCKRFSSKN